MGDERDGLFFVCNSDGGHIGTIIARHLCQHQRRAHHHRGDRHRCIDDETKIKVDAIEKVAGASEPLPAV